MFAHFCTWLGDCVFNSPDTLYYTARKLHSHIAEYRGVGNVEKQKKGGGGGRGRAHLSIASCIHKRQWEENAFRVYVTLAMQLNRLTFHSLLCDHRKVSETPGVGKTKVIKKFPV